MFVYLGAERAAVAAEKEGRKIAVEVQSFLGQSLVRGLEEAVGQYDVYRAVLTETEPDRILYLALPGRAYETLLTDRFGQLIVSRLHLRLLVFDAGLERIISWIESSAIA